VPLPSRRHPTDEVPRWRPAAGRAEQLQDELVPPRAGRRQWRRDGAAAGAEVEHEVARPDPGAADQLSGDPAVAAVCSAADPARRAG
jgi:hypothetical protein